MTIEEFYNDFRQDLLARSGAKEDFSRSTFVEHMSGLLEEQGVISSSSAVNYKFTQKGYAVDAWSLEAEFGHLVLMLADYRDTTEIDSMTNSEIRAGFNRMVRFVQACGSKSYAESLDESMPVAELAWLLADSNRKIERLTLILLTNAKVSSRVDSLPTAEVAGLPSSYEVWDLSRLYRLESSGREREDIEVDLTAVTEGGIRCLPAFVDEGPLKSYLLVLPGAVLAGLYRQYGERLFEQNVRTFLQFRGKVNKGIRNTIIQSPQMFFSYNNGISATADEVVTSREGDRILKVRNLQVVNGGQTTASIFTAGRNDKADLSNVHVQVKLTVVAGDLVNDIVPRISEYSNTQNKVSAADFFSNHPFHLRIEEFSRRLWAPARDGVRETHWFYERARGQYANKQASLSVAEQRRFLLQNPRSQMFTKTDLAKFHLSFEQMPHIVSLGAQKAFAGEQKRPGFVSMIAKEWEGSRGVSFNELWFKRAIAKAIFFRDLDRLVLEQPWYSGYKANIVTYTLAKFAVMVADAGKHIDFQKIWQLQTLPSELASELVGIAGSVANLLTKPPADVTANPSEWAKNPGCWDLVRGESLRLGAQVRPYLISSTANSYAEREGDRDQTIKDGIGIQTYVVQQGSAHWQLLREWNEKERRLTEKEMGVLEVACAMPRRLPSEAQCAVLVAAEKRAVIDGFHNPAAKRA